MNTKKIIVTVIVAAALALSLRRILQEGPRGKRRRRKAAFDRSKIMFPVETQPVALRSLVYTVNAVGSVDAFEKVQVTARVSGVVDRVLFSEGSFARVDQILVEIEPERYSLAVEAAQASYEKAVASLADAEAGLKRRVTVTDQNPGLIPGEEVETWRTRVAVAKSDVAQTKAALNQAKLNLHDAYVRAPFSGILQTRTVQTGQYVETGHRPGHARPPRSPAPPVQGPRARRRPAPDRDEGRFPGPELGDAVLGSKIVHVAESADETTRLVAVTAEVEDTKDEALRPGTFAEIIVPVSSERTAPVIPQTAIRPSDRGFIAFVVENDTAVERILQLGMRTADGQVEVLSGLKLGEKLVVRGAEALRDGAPVKESAAPTAAAPVSRPAGSGEGLDRSARETAMNLTEVCVKKPVLAWMLMAATIVFGLVAAARIGISQFPDVDFPTISVSVVWEGAAPEVIENDIVEPLEEALVQIEGLQDDHLELPHGLGQHHHRARPLPERRPGPSGRPDQGLPDRPPPAPGHRSARSSPSPIPRTQPILMISIGGPFPPARPQRLRPVRPQGEAPDHPGRRRDHADGRPDPQRPGLARRRPARREGPDRQRRHPGPPARARRAAGRPARDARAARSTSGSSARPSTSRRSATSSSARSAGAPSTSATSPSSRTGSRTSGGWPGSTASRPRAIGIKKQRGANAVAVAKAAKEAMAEYAKTLPEGMTVNIVFDSTQFIEDSVKEIQFELILSVILTALVCWMFLGSLSSTLNVILAIPMSLMGTIAIIYFLGFTFNTFTLLGLALAVGIVVDDAIMVMENIFRHREGGKGLVAAALEGTHEIAFAALAATLAVVAIFVPVVFIKGIIGRFFLQFGITLCLAVLLSYIEAVTLAPARCSQFLKTTREGRSRIGLVVDRQLPLARAEVRPRPPPQPEPARPDPRPGGSSCSRRPWPSS